MDAHAELDRQYQMATLCDGPWRLSHEIEGDTVLLRVTADGATLFEVPCPIEDGERARDAAWDVGLGSVW
jgi:hypothetical protein